MLLGLSLIAYVGLALPFEIGVKDASVKSGQSRFSILESLRDWFKDEHTSQVGPLRAKIRALAGMIMKSRVSFFSGSGALGI